MASQKVLKEAIKKLTFNTKVLKEKRKTCATKTQVEEIDKQIAQNESMILDYKFRLITQNT